MTVVICSCRTAGGDTWRLRAVASPGRLMVHAVSLRCAELGHGGWKCEKFKGRVRGSALCMGGLLRLRLPMWLPAAAGNWRLPQAACNSPQLLLRSCNTHSSHFAPPIPLFQHQKAQSQTLCGAPSVASASLAATA